MYFPRLILKVLTQFSAHVLKCVAFTLRENFWKHPCHIFPGKKWEEPTSDPSTCSSSSFNFLSPLPPHSTQPATVIFQGRVHPTKGRHHAAENLEGGSRRLQPEIWGDGEKPFRGLLGLYRQRFSQCFGSSSDRPWP